MRDCTFLKQVLDRLVFYICDTMDASKVPTTFGAGAVPVIVAAADVKLAAKTCTISDILLLHIFAAWIPEQYKAKSGRVHRCRAIGHLPGRRIESQEASPTLLDEVSSREQHGCQGFGHQVGHGHVRLSTGDVVAPTAHLFVSVPGSPGNRCLAG